MHEISTHFRYAMPWPEHKQFQAVRQCNYLICLFWTYHFWCGNDGCILCTLECERKKCCIWFQCSTRFCSSLQKCEYKKNWTNGNTSFEWPAHSCKNVHDIQPIGTCLRVLNDERFCLWFMSFIIFWLWDTVANVIQLTNEEQWKRSQ